MAYNCLLSIIQSGKQHIGYIYGVAVVGCSVLYLILNLMSPQGVDIPKTASVLGYCMLPLVMLSSLSTLFTLKYESHEMPTLYNSSTLS